MSTVSTAARNGLPPARNPRAYASVVVGITAVACVPAGVALSSYTERVTLVQSMLSAVLAGLLGIAALVLSRRGREAVERTLGRAGGRAAARAGSVLGALAIWAAATSGLAVAFYAVLTFFD